MEWLIAILLFAVGFYAVRLIRRRREKYTFKEYGHSITRHDVGRYGKMDFALWLHPRVWAQNVEHFEQSEIDALREYVSEGDLVIDIGAHMGDTTVPLAFAAGQTGITIAIEPNPYVFKVLEINAKLNSESTNIVPMCFAVTESEGKCTFLYSDASFCNGGDLGSIEDQSHKHKFPLEVDGRNLENILRRDYKDKLHRLTYIKIDVEGYDKEVIRSISGILREFRPTLVAEVLKKLTPAERDELYDVLQSCGYQPYLHTASIPLKGQRINRDDMSNWRHFDILAIPEN